MFSLCLLLAGHWLHGVHAGELRVYATDHDGNALEDAVFLATPTDPAKMPQLKPHKEIVDQIDKEFVPTVKPVLVGSLVYFPNKDNIRHHVYSFSSAKNFELPLYAGKSAPPVFFDKPGVVVLGCNIHDWMVGYIYVSDTPFFAKTARDGKGTIENLPIGEYLVRAWHPRLDTTNAEGSRRVSITDGVPARIDWQLLLKPAFKIPRAPIGGNDHHY